MSSRQSLSRRQGKAVLQKSQPLHIGISSDYRAYGVRIDWTDAKVVKVWFDNDSSFEVIEAAVLKGELLEGKHIQYHVEAGDVLYFARSSHGNFYYICRWAGDHFCCSCPAAHKCHHQSDVTAYAQQSSEARLRMEEEAANTASSDRVEYGYIEQPNYFCYPRYRVNGGEWQHFLDESGQPVEIFSACYCEEWLQIVRDGSQVEADIWYSELLAKLAA